MTLFEKTIKMKVVDLEKFSFSFEVFLSSKTTFEFLKFKIQIL